MSNFKVLIPEATTNIFENPSFENGLTGWTQAGTWTTVTSDQWYGASAAKCTALSGGSGSLLDTITLSVTTHAIQAMVKRAAGGVVDNTITQIRRGGTAANWTTFTHIQDGWYHCTGTLVGAPTVGLYVYEADILVDALQIEEKEYWTTYTDGDMTGHRDRLSTSDESLTGYAWTGTAHASTSTRNKDERSGGREWDLESLGVASVNGWNGFGVPEPQHHITPFALLPGAQHKGKRIPERVIDIICTFSGSDIEDWHGDRLDLADAVSVDLVYPDQPFTLRYTVGSTPRWLQIDGRYAGGLLGTNPNKFIERAPARILAVSPFWRRLKQEVTTLTINTPGTVTNNGKQRALPVLRIEGEGSIDSLANSTTGQALEFNLFLNPGESFILDLENKTIVRKSGGVSTSILGAHTGGRINKWWLDRGDNSITVSASDSGTLITESGDTLLTEAGDTLITSATLNITKCQLEFFEQFETVDGI